MILLDTNTSLEIVLDTTPTTELDWFAVYFDTADDSPYHSDGKTNGTTDVALVTSPSSGKRLVKHLNIYNNNSSLVVLTVKIDDGINEIVLLKSKIGSGVSFIYDSYTGWNSEPGPSPVIDDLADVDASSPTDGQALLYNSTSENWEASDITTSNDYVDSASGSGDGTLTLSRTDGVDVTVDLSHSHTQYLLANGTRDVGGDMNWSSGNAAQFGSTFEVKYNSTSNSLDFNFIG